MKILMVGSGGREHALIKKFKESGKVTQVICAPGNGGIACDAQCFPVPVTDIEAMIKLAADELADLVFIAPDDPLASGMADAMQAAGLRVFGPSAKAAEIESSKVFAKALMKKYAIPTADYEVFESAQNAIEYISSRGQYPTVIKADGLALGKGVIIAEKFEQAQQAVQGIMNDKVFGDAGSKIVVEEFLTGPEVSVLAFTDGVTLSPMVSSMDHKKALNGDRGLNTGGMGAIAPNPFYTAEYAQFCMEHIFLPTLAAMNAEGRTFKGCLYFGLMLTAQGPKVIEYNCRFGDPETQAVLPLLKTPLIDVVDAVIDGNLAQLELEWSSQSSACVILASGGYPSSYAKGYEIKGLDSRGSTENVAVYHAGTLQKDGSFYTNGGRVLGISAQKDTLAEALAAAYRAIDQITFENMHFRTDIGACAI